MEALHGRWAWGDSWSGCAQLSRWAVSFHVEMNTSPKCVQTALSKRHPTRARFLFDAPRSTKSTHAGKCWFPTVSTSLCASYLFISQNIRCLQLRGCFLEPWNKACVLQGAAQVHQDGRCSLLLPLANAAQQCNDSEDWDTKRRERKLPTDYVRTGTGLGEVSLLQTAAVGIFPNELW